MAITGLHCADCAANVERVLLKERGVSLASVSAVTGKAQVRYDATLVQRAAIVSAIAVLGYRSEVLPDSATDSRLMLRLGSPADSPGTAMRTRRES